MANYTGLAVIVCNQEFRDNESGNTIDDMYRHGAQVDVNRLETTLTKLGFIVKTLWNVNSPDMVVKIDTAIKCQDDIKNADCFLCVISSHGDNDNDVVIDEVIKGSDNLYVPIRDITFAVSNTRFPDFVDKPKIFLMQCCRGQKLNTNVELEESWSGEVLDAHRVGYSYDVPPQFDPDRLNLPYNIPLYKDYLLHYSTVPGFLSLRNTQHGSPFLQKWCDVLETSADDTDFLSMTTIVNDRVVREYTANIRDQFGDVSPRKLMPQAASMLTKDFFLHRVARGEDSTSY